MKEYCPVAAAANVVEFGKVRFTLLTDRMLRMEWAADGAFEDRATLVAVNRRMPRVAFAQTVKGDKLVIKTDALSVEYVNDGKKLSARNLKIAFKAAGKRGTWSPGMKDRENLKGTYRTLDGFLGDRNARSGKKIPLCDGLLSRNGWSFFDDSDGVVMAEGLADQPWAAARPEGRRQDYYFLAYGLDFKAAVADAAKVFGHQPLPPRYTLGYWWSRYWEYNDQELEQIVNEFNTYKVPLDVLVIDMDWHKELWTGYSWDKRFFPDPEEFLGWLKSHDLKITLNLHPADGVGKHEDQFADMAAAMGKNPRTTDRIEFDCTDPTFMDAYFKILHHPQEDMGVDFWWMDWQQGTATALPSLDPLSWLNHLHYADMARRSPKRRPLIFSRFGGLGAGRYPVGFSGDTYINWKSLAYQPYFTATAANVLYGYWSHDIGGHHLGELTPELYLRWIQFGIFSPVFRTHTSKNPDFERRVWKFPSPYSEHMLAAIDRRYEMTPYIYTECRKMLDTGVSLCRPMYYEHPADASAYDADGQYYFGDEMIVSPAVAPASDKDEMTVCSTWLPKGKWFDAARGVWETGGKTVKHRYGLNEVPVFVRPGAVIPGQRAGQRLRPGSYDDLMITAYPGGDGSYDLYEDDGISQAYENGESATIKISQKASAATRTIKIAKAKGSYRGFKAARSLELRLPATGNASSVTVDGKELAFAYRLGDEGWSWDPAIGGIVLRVEKIDVSAGCEVKIAFAGRQDAGLGLAGAYSRLERIRQLASFALILRLSHELCRVHAEGTAAVTRIAMAPETIDAEKRLIKRTLAKLDKALAWRLAHAPNKERAKSCIAKARAIAKELKGWFK